MVLAVVVGAAVVAGALIVASAQTGGSNGKSTATSARTTPAGPKTAKADALLEGIRQRGLVLGSPKAPVTLVEFADLQCPYCAVAARESLPTVIREYVRSGSVRIVFEGLAFVGDDSETALRAVLAAGLQNHAWDMIESLYLRQGAENSGWVTAALLKEVAAEVPGLDADRMLSEVKASAVDKQLAASERTARSANVRGTPSFFVGRTNGPLEPVDVSSFTAGALRPALDEALAP